MIGLTCNLYQRGAAGVPTISAATFRENLAPRLTSYEHTISATFGFETCRLSLITDLETALGYADNLMGPIVVSGPDADTVWEGYVESVDIQAGGEQRSYSIQPMHNRVRVRYTTVLGTPGVTATATDATSAGLYGTKDLVTTIGNSSATPAASLRDQTLAAVRLPTAVPSSDVAYQAQAAGGSGVQVTITCAGWYATLGWVLTARTDTTSEATTTQVGALIGTSSPGIGATNPFLSTSTANIATTGISVTRLIPPDTSYRAAIEERLKQGDTGGQRYAWGVYEDRAFHVAQWAGATPTTIGYRTRLGSGVILDGNGAVIMPWRVRPNAMVEAQDFVIPGPPSGAIDTPGRYFVERVVCRIDRSRIGVTMEPAGFTSLDARLARIS